MKSLNVIKIILIDYYLEVTLNLREENPQSIKFNLLSNRVNFIN